MNKAQFLTEVERQLKNIFVALKQGRTAPKVEKHRCEGFMRAGVFCGLVTNSELTAVMEKVHIDILGESTADRKARKEGQWKEQEMDYSLYEPPAIGRVD
jgi:hypothetical protein